LEAFVLFFFTLLVDSVLGLYGKSDRKRQWLFYYKTVLAAKLRPAISNESLNNLSEVGFIFHIRCLGLSQERRGETAIISLTNAYIHTLAIM